MDGLTLQQIEAFLAVVDHGGVAAAARALARPQTVVTYQIQMLERQAGLALFDRAGYRIALNDVGRAVEPQMRQAAAAISALRMRADELSDGIEAELSIAVSTTFPTDRLVLVLQNLQARFPKLVSRVFIDNLGGAARLVAEGTASLCITVAGSAEAAGLSRTLLFDIDVVAIASPDHPLARTTGPIMDKDVSAYRQIAVTDRTGAISAAMLKGSQDKSWLVSDINALQAIVKAGLGWGILPGHFVQSAIAAGELVPIWLDGWSGLRDRRTLTLCVAYKDGAYPGPAARWLIDHLVALGPQ